MKRVLASLGWSRGFATLGAALAIALVTEVPYTLAHGQSGAGWRFSMMMWSPYDQAVYSAAMHEGVASSSWLIHNHMTSEPHRPILIHTLYVALGKLAAASHLTPDLLFRLATVAGRLALLLSLWRLAGTAYDEQPARGLGFVLAFLSTGAGMWIPTGQGLGLLPATPEPFRPTFNMYPEFNTFLVLFTTPHLLFALALSLEATRTYLQAWQPTAPSAPVLRVRAGLAALLLGLTNPFSVAVVLAPLVLHLSVSTLLERRLAARPAAVGLGVAVLGLPMPLYSVAVTMREPVWQAALSTQCVLPAPDLAHLLEGFGALTVLALLGLPVVLREPRPRSLILPIWVLTSLALMYAPVPYQRRFGFGLHPVLALQAAVGLGVALRWACQGSGMLGRVRRVATRFVLLALLFGANIALVALLVRISTSPADHPLYFQPTAVANAAQWLSRQLAPDDIVLADVNTGNSIARYGRGRVYVGHHITTVDFERKLTLVRQFLSGNMDPARRQTFLHEAGIDYILFGPAELALGGQWLASAPYLAPVYHQDGVTVHQVQ